jgi:hypothetical protein
MKTRKEYTFLDTQQNRVRLRTGFYILLVILLVIDLFIPKHGHFPWEAAFAFYAAYGFIGCVGLIFIAKGLRWLVQRKEDYYD